MAYDYAEAFSTGLFRPDFPVPEDMMVGAGKEVQSRYNVYRNNVTVSLIDALAAVYPAVQRITGTAFFRAMARFYVRALPPESPLLFEYGRSFPDFIESYEFAQDMPWLADTARIERAWLDAYHAADRPVMVARALTAVPPAALADLRFCAHPAARIVRSIYPAVAIFVMNRREGPVSSMKSSAAEDALITRPEQEVIVSRLPAGGAVFLSSLLQGLSLGVSASKAFEQAPEFDLSGNLAAMITAGVFTGINLEM